MEGGEVKHKEYSLEKKAHFNLMAKDTDYTTWGIKVML